MITRNKAELARQRQQAALERAVQNRAPLGSTPAPARSPSPPGPGDKPAKRPNPVHKPKP